MNDNLFAEMDEVADRISTQPEFIPQDLQIHFRQLQRVYQPQLSQAEWLALFYVWRDGYLAKVDKRRTDALQAILAIIGEVRP
jgi:hypothetical protein